MSEKKLTTKEYFQGLGRRKAAIAQVRLYAEGTGETTINGKQADVFFPYFEFKDQAFSPLKTLGLEKKFDMSVKVAGGGSRGQAEAIKLGVARALVVFNEENKKLLRASGFLSRDPRIKERKKPGLKRARRAPQWAKR